jgi:hypothetical protein
MKQKFKAGDTVKYIGMAGVFKVVATKEEPYDGRGSSPYNELIEVKDNYDYRICEIKKDNAFSKFIDAIESELTLHEDSGR